MNSQSQAFLVQELFERFVSLTSNIVEAKEEYLNLWQVFSGFLKKSPLDYEEIYSFIRKIEKMNSEPRPSTTETLFDTEENISLPPNQIRSLRKMISMDVPNSSQPIKEIPRARSRHESLIPFKNRVVSPNRNSMCNSENISFEKSSLLLHKLVPQASEYIMNSNSVYGDSMIANFGNAGNSKQRNISETFFRSVSFAHFWKLLLIEDGEIGKDIFKLNLRFYCGDDVNEIKNKIRSISQNPKEIFVKEVRTDLRLLDYLSAYLKELIFLFLEDWEVTDKKEKLMKAIMLNSISYSDELLQISAHVLKRPIEMHFYSQKKIEVFSFSKKSECFRDKVILFYDDHASNCMNFIDIKEYERYVVSNQSQNERRSSQVGTSQGREFKPPRMRSQVPETSFMQDKPQPRLHSRGRSPQYDPLGRNHQEKSFQQLPLSANGVVNYKSDFEFGNSSAQRFSDSRKKSMERNSSMINLNYQYGAPMNSFHDSATPKAKVPVPTILSNRNSMKKVSKEQVAPFDSHEKRSSSISRPSLISPKNNLVQKIDYSSNKKSNKTKRTEESFGKENCFNPGFLLEKTNLLVSLMETNTRRIEEFREDGSRNGYRLSNFQ